MLIGKKIFSPLLHLFYPYLCAGCGNDHIEPPNLLCLRCFDQLPGTGYAFLPGNPIEKLFWGRVPLYSAMSEFYFSKGNILQLLVHELKYKGNKEIGSLLGNLVGESLMKSERFPADVIIPLPLFARRELKRGYNQAEILCRGIKEVLNISLVTGNVIRRQDTETQTKKGRIQRWENVVNTFVVEKPSALEGKHILLVDDVITTGATLEACSRAIFEIPGVRISIATLACATI